MSLKAKLKPYIFALGLIFSLFSFNSVFAYSGVGLGVTPTMYYEPPTSFIKGSQSIIPYSAFPSTSSCMYHDSNYFIMGQKIDSSGNILSSNYSASRTIEQLSSGFNPGYLNLGNASDYSASGTYYFQFVGYDHNGNVCANSGFSYYPFVVDKNAGTITAGSITPPNIDGTCGSANGIIPTTIPIPEGSACSAGTLNNLHSYYDYQGMVFAWSCIGSGEGISVTCASAHIPDAINGTCGSANGQTLSSPPSEENKCATGATNASTYTTLSGWTWFCYGMYGGTNVACSATNSGITPPTIPTSAPIPTPTDCDSYSGIDKVLCNFGNTIQGMFLPSTDKLTELQTTINKVGNVFPFNYLNSIGSIFSNSTVTEGTLTMTLLGNTSSLEEDFFDMPLFANFKMFMTVMILLMFTFWAINYIKHFFK